MSLINRRSYVVLKRHSFARRYVDHSSAEISMSCKFISLRRLQL